MRVDELANKLREMYNNAEDGEKVAMIHLFGIKYAKELLDSGESKTQIATLAGLSSKYGTEISKGIKLDKYVELKRIYR